MDKVEVKANLAARQPGKSYAVLVDTIRRLRAERTRLMAVVTAARAVIVDNRDTKGRGHLDVRTNSDRVRALADALRALDEAGEISGG